jgi:hypothetical protein
MSAVPLAQRRSQTAATNNQRMVQFQTRGGISHRLRIPGFQTIYAPKKQGPDFRPALLVTRFIRPHPGVQKGGAATWGSLSGPRHGQNPYANPEWTAKSAGSNDPDKTGTSMANRFALRDRPASIWFPCRRTAARLDGGVLTGTATPLYLAYATVAINNYLWTTPPGNAPVKFWRRCRW